MYHYPVHVEFEDIDSYGIIHHPRILYFMERARCSFLKENGVDIRTGHINEGLVLRNFSVNVKSQILMFDVLDVELSTSKIDKYRFNFEYVFRRDGKIMASAVTEMVYIDLQTKKLIEIPDVHRRMLESIRKD